MLSIQHTLKSIASMPHLVAGGRPAERAGDDLLFYRRLGVAKARPIQVSSPAFAASEPVPPRYTADGPGISPPLRWEPPPSGTQSLVLICEDPDAPLPLPFVHWVLYDVSPQIDGLPEGLRGDSPVVLNGGQVGRSTLMRAAWIGCGPPRGDAPHHYHFQLFALDRVLNRGRHVGRGTLLHDMRRRVIGFGELVGTYQR